MKKAIGVDIGGTKIAVALINEFGTIQDRIDIKTDTSDGEKLYQSLVTLIQQLLIKTNESLNNLSGIGLGVPGKVDAENGIAVFQNNIPWPNFPIVERLRQDFPNTTIKIDNDVKVAAYAEYRLLKLQPNDLFGYLTVSTGIACTNIINNQILRGSGFSGEVGFLPVPSSTGLRAVEKVAAGPAIEQAARVLYQDDTLTTEEVFQRWQKCEWQATEIIEQSITGIAITLYSMICLLDPKAIVLGGSLPVHNSKYVENIKLTLEKMMHEEQLHILNNIHVSKLEGHNGIIGAGMLVI